MIMKTEVLAAALNSIRQKKSCEERLHSSKRVSGDFPIMIDDASSDDVYYRSESSVGNIPFVWESQPGTPKYKSSWRPESPLLIPPLTPPPSFHSSPAAVSTKKNHSQRKKNNLVPSVLLPKLKLNNQSPPSRSTSSSSSWSTSSLSPLSSSGTTPKQRRVRSSSPRRMTSSFDDSRIEELQGESCAESPVSTSSYGGGAGGNINGRSSGCYSSIIRLLYAR
ncbi:hypothetical protein ACP275_04G083900 [Erythranthe tilingii]